MNLLIIRPGALGDTLMLMPSIHQLKDLADIFIAGRYPGIDYIRPYVEKCFDYEQGGWQKLFQEGPDTGFLNTLPKMNVVAAFLSDPDGIASNNLKIFFPSAEVHSFHPFPPEMETVHAALYISRSLESAGLLLEPEKSMGQAWARPLVNMSKTCVRKDLVVLHPGSGSEKKNYSAELWLELANRLESIDLKILVLIGPAEQGMRPVFENRKDTNVVFCPEKDELLDLLSCSPLYIGHDSGVTHLAAMMGIPVIALFKNSSSIQWRPLGPFVEVIEGNNDDRTLIRIIIRYRVICPLK